jgi:O-antigen ligase
VAWEAIESLTKIVLPFVTGITLLDSTEKTKRLAWVMLLSQGYLAYELNLSYYQGFNQLQELGMCGMDNNSVAIGMVAGTALGFFLGLSVHGWWRKAVAFGCAGVMAHAVLFSFSRGGVLSLIVTGIVGFLLMPKHLKHYLTFALAVILCIRLAGQQIRERFMTAFVGTEQLDPSARGRLDLWRDCWDVMTHRPVLGLGLENWPLTAPEYGWPVGKYAHSLWLQVGAEVGFPGLLFLLVFYGSCLMLLWPLARARKLSADPWTKDSARLVFASLVGFIVAAQFVSLWGLELPYYIVLLGAGVLKLSSTPNTMPMTNGRNGRCSGFRNALTPSPFCRDIS